MSSTGYDVQLDIRLNPSRWLTALVITMHVVAMIIVVALSVTIPVWLVIGLVAIIALSLYRTLNKDVLLRSRRAIVRVIVSPDDDWILMTREGKNYKATLLPGSYVHPYLMILNFSLVQERRKLSVVLLKDSLDPTTARHLRARLLAIKSE